MSYLEQVILLKELAGDLCLPCALGFFWCVGDEQPAFWFLLWTSLHLLDLGYDPSPLAVCHLGEERYELRILGC